jgi:hypothetical protein
MTKILIAAIAALFTAISVPASAQTQQSHSPQGHPGPYPYHQHHHPGNHSSGQVWQQPINPPFVGLCVVPDVGSCKVFLAPGSYCECKNWIGEIFSGTVE